MSLFYTKVDVDDVHFQDKGIAVKREIALNLKLMTGYK